MDKNSKKGGLIEIDVEVVFKIEANFVEEWTKIRRKGGLLEIDVEVLERTKRVELVSTLHVFLRHPGGGRSSLGQIYKKLRTGCILSHRDLHDSSK